jgi:hypothetical protein
MTQPPESGALKQEAPTGLHAGHILALAVVAIVVFSLAVYAVGAPDDAAQQQERVETAAAQTVQFGQIVAVAVRRLAERGVLPADMDFNPEGVTPQSVFYSQGGGAAWQQPAALFGTQARWHFIGMDSSARGWFVPGAGTDAADGKDAVAYIDGVPAEVCQAINDRLNLGPQPMVQSLPVDFSTPGGEEARAGNNAWTFYARAARDSAPAACIQNGVSGPFVYYQVIYAR